MPPYDPWAVAVSQDVTIAFTRLTRARGYTDGIGVVWLDSRLTAVEARCTLAHELTHITLGHVGRSRPAEEVRVRTITARLLVPWAALVGAAADGLDPWQAADRLQVTPEILSDRYCYATTAELAYLAEHADHPDLGLLDEVDKPFWRTE